MEGNTIQDGGEMSGQEVNDMITLSRNGWELGRDSRYAGGDETHRYPQIRRDIHIGTVQYTQYAYFQKSDYGNWHTSCYLGGSIDQKKFATLNEAVAYLNDWKPSVEMQLEHLNQAAHSWRLGLKEAMDRIDDLEEFKDEVSAFIKRGMTGTIKLD